MKAFSVYAGRMKDTGEEVTYGKFVYHVYTATIGRVEIPVLMDGRKAVAEGVQFFLKKAVLTFYEKDGKNILCIRAVECYPAEEVREPKDLTVRIGGRLVKSPKVQLQKVTVCQYPFVCCSLLLQNEVGKKFLMQLVAFCRSAETLVNLPDGSVLELECKIKKKKYGEGCELNVSDILAVRYPRGYDSGSNARASV